MFFLFCFVLRPIKPGISVSQIKVTKLSEKGGMSLYYICLFKMLSNQQSEILKRRNHYKGKIGQQLHCLMLRLYERLASKI